MGACAGVLAAAVLAAWMWDFTIDDALISIRYARHLAAGAGYRFNAEGPSTDGVTPLPWPFLLAPFARAEALDVLFRVKVLGLVAWLAAAAAWGVAVTRADAPRLVKMAAYFALAACVPVAAHAVSGMETGVVLALATWASLASPRPARAAAIAGVVAAFRPEMVVWAVALALGLRTRRGLAFAVLPLIVCTAARLVAFGHAAPLAVLAKPSDLPHGVVYVAAASLVALAPVLACAPVAAARSGRIAGALTVAGAAHLVAVALAGGDWMPFARLVAPVVPSLLYAFVLSARRAHPLATGARLALAAFVAVYTLVRAAPAGRHVGAHDRALIARARPVLQGATRVAALDIGWPTAATEATIIDLAGLTDPFIAALPGGHTSKRIDAALLLERDPDVVLVYELNGEAARVVEARLVRAPLFVEHFRRDAFLRFGESTGYAVWRRVR